MFGRVRDFARRHRGKLITVGVVGGAAYFLSRYAARKVREWQESAASELLEQGKKQLHFDSTQRTAAETTASVAASITAKVEDRFNSEAIIAEIKGRGAAASSADKMPLWDRLKSCSLCKAFAGIYGTAMLSVLVRVQLNIVGGYLFVKLTRESGSDPQPAHPTLTPEDQETYLSAMARFVDSGFPSFCDEMERVVSEVVRNVSLKDRLTFERVSSLIYSVKNEVDVLVQRRLVEYLFPLETQAAVVEGGGDSGQGVPPVSVVVQETRDVLENPDVFSLLRHLTQMGTNEILDALAREWIVKSREAEAAQSETKPEMDPATTAPETNANVIPQRPLFHQFSMPFAKLLPLFAGFSPNSVLRDMSRSEQLRSFAANVYETFSVPPMRI